MFMCFSCITLLRPVIGEIERDEVGSGGEGEDGGMWWEREGERRLVSGSRTNKDSDGELAAVIAPKCSDLSARCGVSVKVGGLLMGKVRESLSHGLGGRLGNL
ncbi:hypothetical protein Tco_0936532 [Tanacetum coccineum]